jgi:imidazolonepropionase-like amidohydrolase
MARQLAISPDGKTTVFNTLGKLYMPQKSGEPKRVTTLPDDVREVFPEFSRDGKEMVFVTWTDEDLAQIHVMNVRSKRIETLDLPKGHYARPSFSPDGEFIVYERNTGGGLRTELYSTDPGLYIYNREAGGAPVRFSKTGGNPHFGDDDLRVFFNDYESGNRVLKSANLLGGDVRTHASNKMAQLYRVSHDGKHLAFTENYNLYVTPLLPGPQQVGASKDSTALPVTKLSEKGATYPSWFEDGHIAWSMGPHLYMADAGEMMADADVELMEMADTLSVNAGKYVPNGRLALTGATVITMTDEEGGIMEDATILIEGDRIKAVGQDVDIPRGTERLDLDGKIIIPGLIDAHAHGPAGSDDVIMNANWNSIAHLAFGVTTTFNPSSDASEILSFKEMQRTGRVIGPRTFTTGEVIYGAKAPGFFAFIDSYEDALEHVARLDEQGAIAVKNYNQPRRDQRQQVVQAARERDVLTVFEGGSLFHMDMNAVADGNSSIEHNIPQETLYADVVQMFAQSNVANTQTLGVTYGGIRGENYYLETTDVWKHPILSKHTPPDMLRAQTQRRQKAPVSQYYDDRAARATKPLFDEGVYISIGGHGQREGLAAHWEMQTFQRGGYSPLEALTTATVNPAKHLGMIDDIGTIEAGKLADLVILGDDPLEDIANAESVEHVVQGGRVFEAKTMNEVVTGDAKRPAYPWE